MWDVSTVIITTQNLCLPLYIQVFYTVKEDDQLWYHKSKNILYE